jgi:hypothetical protein
MDVGGRMRRRNVEDGCRTEEVKWEWGGGGGGGGGGGQTHFLG